MLEKEILFKEMSNVDIRIQIKNEFKKKKSIYYYFTK